ncbi:Hsp20/alpha crystallin family protein [Chlorobium sp. N1]|uniref:Hsp20/alpha crystallin family protein n=1 Tax=Chlorobium sp. N1 TaxID=2491138 RepID=UPI00103A4D0A|nr:Hsp20/alpha crystallin family protein [Chlorobium sp. N1]TCD47829.1 Hsp20/alpha crystallin family protein [Chlorobium sp. N1]
MAMKLYGRDPLKLFEDVFNERVSPFFSSIVAPDFKVDVSEDENAVFIEADMPGMKKEDVHVKMEDDVLCIHAEREQSEEEKKKGYHRIERSWGSLSRSFTLGDNVDEENIDAHYDNGVLKIRVPKKEPEPKRGTEIAVK